MSPRCARTRMRLAALTAVVLAAGCTSMPRDQGRVEVRNLVEQRIGADGLELPTLDAEIGMSEDEATRLLAFPLALKDAERMALYRNPRIRARIADVGLKEADFAQAGRLRNPGFSFTRFSSQDYEATTLFDIGGLLMMPLRRKVAARELDIATYRAAGEVINHLADSRRAWIEAVAAAHTTRLMEQALESLEAANQLNRQMAAIGHSSRREAAGSELALTRFRAALSAQRVEEVNRREALIRQLGIYGSDASLLTLPERLEAPPQQPVDYRDVAASAVSNRIDVEMARDNIEALAANLKLTRASPFINVLELGPVLERGDGETERGFEIELVLPLFDWGGIRNERARIAWSQALADAEYTALSAASEARQALHAYRRAWDVANAYRERVLPLQDYINEQELLRYNGMLISVFDLLDNARGALDTQVEYVARLRDFWLADTRLRQVLVAGGGAPLSLGAGIAAAAEDAPGGH